jgi:hypothetical protein
MRAVVSLVIGAGLIACFLIVLLFDDGRLGRDEGAPDDPEVGVELVAPYDASFIAQWVRGCVSSGESAVFCRCAIDTYTRRLRPDEFETAAAVAYSGGQPAELPENVRRAVAAVERDCR